MHSIKAKKSLGQNFLQDKNILETIASSIAVQGKHILEVWPGYGALTDFLIEKSPQRLDLIELDRDMVDILVERFDIETIPQKWWQKWWGVWGGKLSESDERNNWGLGVGTVWEQRWEAKRWKATSFPTPDGFGTFDTKSTSIQLWKEGNIYVHLQDILTFTPPATPYSVIANIPYYITSPILFHFLYESGNPPEAMVILMQKEVGEKILEWRAKKPHHSYLSLALEEACETIDALCIVPRTAFHPAPKVDSIVLRFVVKKTRNRERENVLLSLWKEAFTHPRKTLLSNLKWSQYDREKVVSWLRECDYDEKVRAEAIKREDWWKLIF
jgi:16S rRNA A1518/A1519 N6-dimethyltransferase RsmA/KsgA/DIM1 with predicted DNA glycosylase/AP lyase activity